MMMIDDDDEDDDADTDIDECARGAHRCHGHDMTCVNRPGTYLCQCPEGYQLTDDLNCQGMLVSLAYRLRA